MTAAEVAALLAELRSARQVAELFGITPQQLRRLAKKRGVGFQVDRFLLFTAADVEALTERRPGRRSQFELTGSPENPDTFLFIVRQTGRNH